MAVQFQQLVVVIVRVNVVVKSQKSDMFDGKRDAVIVNLWKYQIRIYMDLMAVRSEQRVVLVLIFLRGSVLSWWLQRQEAVRAGILSVCIILEEFFQVLDLQFVLRDVW